MADRLKFKDFSPHIDVTFWYELERLKLHEWKLDEPLVNLRLAYPTAARSRHQIPNIVSITKESFDPSARLPNTTCASGELLNFNTPEQLKNLDKKKALLDAGARFVAKVLASEDWSTINFASAIMYTFADLKTHKFSYVLAFPAIDLEAPVTVVSKASLKDSFTAAQAAAIYDEAVKRGSCATSLGPAPFVVTPGAGDAVSNMDFTATNASRAAAYVAFSDPSNMADFPGWPLRNIIAALRLHDPKRTELNFIAIRDSIESSIVFKCSCEALPDATLAAAKAGTLKTVGYCETKINSVDLSAMMDPARLADSSAKLNLSLMKWRMMPDIQLEGLQSCRALLLGSGTLGCNIARHLMMWGVTNITLVDRGMVSYSNPVRQTLFELSDVTAEGEKRIKSVAAAAALKRILPTANAVGINMTICMPGHRIEDEVRADAIADMKRLEDLIKSHDVTFLLTDSRESRWLPTVLATAHNKPIINSALGFDSYVVMRHGLPSQGSHRVGCYFCNDVIAPMDSLTARTLDQQCTVTRPGVSAIASAISVEMLAQLYNHPQGFDVPAWTEDGEKEAAAGISASCVLGNIPHQIRGNVRDYNTMTLHGSNYTKCTACSDPIINGFRERGFDFIIDCLNTPQYMEEVSGIKAEMAAVTADHAGWDDEEF